MSDFGRDLGELKREVVEARNQAIKTDNQMKNLSIDIKGFEKRFDALETRVRMSGIGVNLIVALTIAAAAYGIGNVRGKTYEHELANLQTVLKDEKAHAQTQSSVQQKKLSDIEKQKMQHDEASGVAMKVLTLLDNRQDREAGAMLDRLNFNELTSLERKALDRRFTELRQKQAELLYKSGRNNLLANQTSAGIADLKRNLALDPNGRYANQARYQLALALWNSKHYDEAEPLLKTLSQHEDRRVAEEGQYLLATTLARLDKRNEAKSLFARIIANDGRYASTAKVYAQALASGSDLPTDLPGGRIRLPRRAPGATVPTTQAAASQPVAVPVSSPAEPSSEPPKDEAPTAQNE